MSRQPRSPESLDLLLDTICNAFGGVVFLAILVIVLLQMTSQVQSSQNETQVTGAQLAELRYNETQLKQDLESLRESEQFLERNRDRFASDEKEALLATLHDLHSKRDELEYQRNQTQDEIADQLTEVDNTKSELANLDESLQEAQTELAQAVAELKSEVRSRTRGARLPVLRHSVKNSVAVVVRHGRFYVWHRYSINGERLGLNTDDFVIVEVADTKITASPKPYAGVPLRDDDASRKSLARRLARFGPDEYYIDMGVWPDSFAAFKHLRQNLVEQGYEYSIIPMTEEGTLVDRGGEFRGVQ